MEVRARNGRWSRARRAIAWSPRRSSRRVAGARLREHHRHRRSSPRRRHCRRQRRGRPPGRSGRSAGRRPNLCPPTTTCVDVPAGWQLTSLAPNQPSGLRRRIRSVRGSGRRDRRAGMHVQVHRDDAGIVRSGRCHDDVQGLPRRRLQRLDDDVHADRPRRYVRELADHDDTRGAHSDPRGRRRRRALPMRRHRVCRTARHAPRRACSATTEACARVRFRPASSSA